MGVGGSLNEPSSVQQASAGGDSPCLSDKMRTAHKTFFQCVCVCVCGVCGFVCVCVCVVCVCVCVWVCVCVCACVVCVCVCVCDNFEPYTIDGLCFQCIPIFVTSLQSEPVRTNSEQLRTDVTLV